MIGKHGPAPIGGRYTPGMTLAEKLQRLMERRRKTDVASSALISRSALSKYAGGKAMPPADIALRLARALGVPLDWLVDDLQGWPPPPSPGPTVEMAEDDTLMREVAKRYRWQAIEALKGLKQLEGLDCRDMAKRLLAVPAGETLPADLDAQVQMLDGMGGVLQRTIERFNPSRWAQAHDAELPGGEQHSYELDEEDLVQRWMHVVNALEKARSAIVQYAKFREVVDGQEFASRAMETMRLAAQENSQLADPIDKLHLATRGLEMALEGAAEIDAIAARAGNSIDSGSSREGEVEGKAQARKDRQPKGEK